MLMHYETPRLIFKILDGNYCSNVLNFYIDNRELFEKYEISRPQNFYTKTYHRSLLNYEFSEIIKSKNVRFWICKKECPNKIIGTVSFQNMQHGAFSCCQIGYKFDSRHHHQGYAFEAVRNACDIIFKEFNIHRIEAYVMTSNNASKKVLKNCHFQYEGTLQKRFLINNVWEDHELYSLINSDAV